MVTADYDGIAGWYDESLREGPLGIFHDFLLPVVLDLARRYEGTAGQDITYIHEDARSLSSIADGAFDGVVCNMALMDIPDLAASLGAVARILKPEGWFVFSITHPCFQTPGFPRWVFEGEEIVGLEVRDYFEEGHWRRESGGGIRGRVGAYHRTLSTYVNELVGAGLIVERLVEPQPAERLAEHMPGYREVAGVLVARCRKSATSARANS